MWTWIITTVGSTLGRVVALALAAISTISVLYLKGRQDQKMKNKNDTMKQSLEALERERNVERNTDRDSALGRLRKHGDVRDD